MCSDVLDRTSSRLEMIIKDHCKKIMDIEDEPHTAQSTKNEKIHSDMDDTKLHQIEETMKNFLDEVVEVSCRVFCLCVAHVLHITLLFYLVTTLHAFSFDLNFICQCFD